MKSLFSILFLFQGFYSFCFSQKYAEISFGTATLSENYCLSLDESNEIVVYYVADISHLQFQSESEAKKILFRYVNNLVSSKLDYYNKKVYYQIHTNRTPIMHDVKWWNNYLNRKCNK